MQLTLPLANWTNGTTLIIIFGVVCVGLTALVVSFVLGGKPKSEDDDNAPHDENTNV